jgi:hypothetical protein
MTPDLSLSETYALKYWWRSPPGAQSNRIALALLCKLYDLLGGPMSGDGDSIHLA